MSEESRKARATGMNKEENRQQFTRERGTFFGSDTKGNTLEQILIVCSVPPCNNEVTTDLEVTLLVLQVFPMAPKKVGMASVESVEPHWR